MTSENSSWLTVAVNGNKVTFTRTAYAHSSDAGAANPRIATVRITAGTGHLDVTFKQAMASE